jgi:hypothetical protein
VIVLMVLVGADQVGPSWGMRNKIFRGAPNPPVAVCHRWFRFWLVVMPPHGSGGGRVRWLCGRARLGVPSVQNRI